MDRRTGQEEDWQGIDMEWRDMPCRAIRKHFVAGLRYRYREFSGLEAYGGHVAFFLCYGRYDAVVVLSISMNIDTQVSSQ